MARSRLMLVEIEEDTDAWDHWQSYVSDVYAVRSDHPTLTARHRFRRQRGVSWWLIGANRVVLAVGPVLYDTAGDAGADVRQLQALAAAGALESYPYLDGQGRHSFALVDTGYSPGCETADHHGCLECDECRDGALAVVGIAARRYEESYERNLAMFKALRALAVEEVPVLVSSPPTFSNPAGAPGPVTWPPLSTRRRLGAIGGLAVVQPLQEQP